MKRCSRCKTVSSDSEITCGVCGGSLADIPFESEEEVERDQIVDIHREELEEQKALQSIEKRQIALTISEFTVGFGSMVGGIILIGQYNSIYGVLVVLLDMGLVAHAIGLLWRWGRGGWIRHL